jgi:hypothetical protein
MDRGGDRQRGRRAGINEYIIHNKISILAVNLCICYKQEDNAAASHVFFVDMRGSILRLNNVISSFLIFFKIPSPLHLKKCSLN